MKIKAGMLFFTWCMLLCMACQPDAQEEPSQPPNIIYIIADDLGYGDLSFNGQQHFRTPNIDRLAAEGMFFSRHYAGSTVCAPSRSVLMTGLHTGHTPIRGNREVQPEGQYPLADSVRTVAEYLKRAGYVTGAFGKWGLGAPGSEGDPVRQGFDRFFGYNCQRLAHNFYTEYLWDNADTVWLTGNANGGTSQYSHDVIHKQTLDFITANKDKPFFLFMPYTIPHAELLAPEDSILSRFIGQFDEQEYEGYDHGPKFRKGPYGSQSNPKAHFAAMVTRLDYAVGDVMDLLADLGIEENTIIFFTSDNGPHKEGGADPDFFNSGGGLRGYKRDLYEGGIRVPMIARWIGKIKPGVQSDHISAFWDFLPTVCDIAGIEAPNSIDGVSFLPTLTGMQTQQRQHDHLYWEFHEQGGKQAVLKENLKAIKLNMLDDPDQPLELYDLSSDPQEATDIAAEHPEVVRDMKAIMDSSHEQNPVFRFRYEKDAK